MTALPPFREKADPFRLFLIANDPVVAEMASRARVDYVMVDLEISGKRERQRNRDTLISGHVVEDISTLRPVCPPGSLVVRIDPWCAGGRAEIEEVIARGADQIMLPMYRSASEVHELAVKVRGRAGVIPLVETPEALECVSETARIENVTRLHFGLNDLHLAFGARFMFELLVDGTLSRAVDLLKKFGCDFGIGGVARVGEGLVPAELIVGEHVRLGSSGAILSRTFHRRGEVFSDEQAASVLTAEVARLRAAVDLFRAANGTDLARNREALVAAISAVVDSLPPCDVNG